MCKCEVRIHENLGELNWELIKKSAVSGIMIRAGYGAGSVDHRFRANADACERMGIPFGVYWTSYAVTETEAEAEEQELLGMIEEYQVRGPVRREYDRESLHYIKYKIFKNP